MNDVEPKTLMEAVRYFSDPAVCLEYMKSIKVAGRKNHLPEVRERQHRRHRNAGNLEMPRLQKTFSAKGRYDF